MRRIAAFCVSLLLSAVPCDGEDASPPLSISGVPAAAKSLALFMDDPDAPPGTWVHRVLCDLPPGTKALVVGLAKKESLPDGAKHGLCWGVDSFTRVGYHGPCPPPGKAGHILAETELVGKFGR